MTGRRARGWALLLLAADAAGLVLAGLAAFSLRYATALGSLAPAAAAPSAAFALLLPVAGLAQLACLALLGGYRLPQPFRLWRTARAVAAGAVVTVLLIFGLRLGSRSSAQPFLYSRAVLLLTWGLSLAWFVAVRYLFLLALRRFPAMRSRVAVAGTGPEAEQVAARLRAETWLGYELAGHLAATPEQGGTLGSVFDLERLLPALRLDELWLALPDDDWPQVLDLVELCRGLPVIVRTGPGQFRRLASRVREAGGSGGPVTDELLHDLARAVRHDLALPAVRLAFLGSRGIPATWGGVERYVEEVGTRLARRGYQVTVYCRPYYMTAQKSYQGVRLVALPTIPTKHLDAIVHTALATVHALVHGEDLFHYVAIGPAILSCLPRLAGRATVVTVQGLDWQRAKWGPVARRVLQLGEWASATFPQRTIVVSETLAQHYGACHGRAVVTIPNGQDEATPRAPQAIDRWRLDRDGYVLFVGRLVPEKGCHTLVEAFRQVRTDKRLVLAGGSSHSDDYVARLRAMPGAEAVVFTGYVYDDILAELFSNAYLFVLPSEIEGRSIALLEALSYGNCVLVSDIPENCEVVNGHGYTFRARDVDDLAGRLQHLLDRPDLVDAARRAARSPQVVAPNWDQVVDATADVYRSFAREAHHV